MIEWLKKRPPLIRVLVYAAAAILAFAVAAGVGATGALILRGDLGLPEAEEPQPPQGQQNAPRAEGKDAAEGELGAGQQNRAGQQQDALGARQGQGGAQQEEDASQQSEADYVASVGDIQADSVETFLDSHDKLLRYDALTADDVEEMQVNKDTLQELTEQASGLDAPQRHRQQYETFVSAIDELHEAAQLAYSLAADPTTATHSGFDEYDRLVGEAAVDLQRSNDALGRDYASIEGVQKVNPLS